MSDAAHAGRLKRSREEMVDEVTSIKLTRSPSSTVEPGGFERDSNFARGRAVFNQRRPVSPYERTAATHNTVSSGDHVPGEKSSGVNSGSDHDSERKPPTGKFSIRGIAIGSGATGATSAAATTANPSGGGKAIGVGRKGGSGASISLNGTMPSLPSGNADTTKAGTHLPVYHRERIRIISGSSNGSGAENASEYTGQSSSVTSDEHEHLAAKTAGKMIKISQALFPASSGATKTNGKGKGKSTLPPIMVRLPANAPQHGNGGTGTAGQTGVSTGSTGRNHSSQQNHQHGATKKSSSLILAVGSASGGGGGLGGNAVKSDSSARSSPALSTSASSSTSTDGDGDDPPEDGSVKAKRRRRTTRVPTPPPGWKAQQASSATQGEASKQRSQQQQSVEKSSAGSPSSSVGGSGTTLGAAVGGRRSKRPTAASNAPTNGRHSSSDTGGAEGKTGNSTVGASVKKRSRPVIKEEVRAAPSGGAAGVPVMSSVSGGRGSGGRGSRGRGSGRGRGRGRGRRRVVSLLESAYPKGPSNKARDTMRWRTHRMVEDFVNTCGNIMYPRVTTGPFGYKPCEGRFPLERPTVLGMMKTEMRRPTIIEKWSPYQVALFEGAISVHGKVFHKVAEEIEGKTVAEVIEFYYMWKKTNHYKQWKAMWRAEQAILQPPDEESDEDVEEAVPSRRTSVASNAGDAERTEKGEGSRGGGGTGRRNGSHQRSGHGGSGHTRHSAS